MNEIIKNASFHHIALAANDFEKSLEFYSKLGFKKIAQWEDAVKKGAMLEIGNGGIFEIFSNGTGEEEKNPRFFHLAIGTDDPDSAYEAAIKAGAASKIEPGDFTINAEKPINIRIAFVYGPSGEILEFFKYRT